MLIVLQSFEEKFCCFLPLDLSVVVWSSNHVFFKAIKEVDRESILSLCNYCLLQICRYDLLWIWSQLYRPARVWFLFRSSALWLLVTIIFYLNFHYRPFFDVKGMNVSLRSSENSFVVKDMRLQLIDLRQFKPLESSDVDGVWICHNKAISWCIELAGAPSENGALGGSHEEAD